jgi:hypothetical protein
MRQVFGSFARGVLVVVVVVTLSTPTTYAAIRQSDDGPVRERIVRVIKRLISVVMGDSLVEPKPTPTP